VDFLLGQFRCCRDGAGVKLAELKAQQVVQHCGEAAMFHLTVEFSEIGGIAFPVGGNIEHEVSSLVVGGQG
jgi:hypothetical protein